MRRKEVRYKIKRAKLHFQGRIEGNFLSNDLSAMWDGMEAMWSQAKKKKYESSYTNGFDTNSNALNGFYLHLNDERGFKNVHGGLFDSLSDCTATPQPTLI